MKADFFAELCAYVGFDDAVRETLAECAVILEPHFDGAVESFYEALWKNARTRAVFEGPEQVDRLRQILQHWIREAFEGPWDTAYFARRDRIGRVHVEVGLLPHFMNGAMNVVRRHLIRELYAAQADIKLIEATEQLLDLELAIMHQSYWDHMMELKLTVPLALATGLAHEIRNPLNAISLNLKILERRMDAVGAEDSMPILEAVRAEVRRIAGLTSEIMDFAKPVELNVLWHRADQFLGDICTLHAPAFEAAGVTLRAETQGDGLCYCDIDRMRQVVVNLLTNAIEAVDPGGEVNIVFESDADSTTIRVVDTGHGMEPAAVYRIFDLFYTQKASGTGLGLPIVKNIVDAHGGRIDVKSRSGQGTTFSIRLPKPQHQE